MRVYTLMLIACGLASCSEPVDPEIDELNAMFQEMHCFWQEREFESIQLETTGCYGRCPVYSLTIFADGRVVYEGFADVDVLGAREAQLEEADLALLHDALGNQMDFFALEDEYRYKLDEQGEKYSITDQPSTFLTLRYSGEVKRVESYFGAPESLENLEALVKELAGSDAWVRGTDSSSGQDGD